MGTDGLPNPLIDQYQRVHDYLRISLTDKCNFRCLYCMPDENMQFWPQERLMQTEEIIAIARLFVSLGVRKIRLTGGEPLVRKDAPAIITALGQLPIELTMTTNGVLLDQCLDVLVAAGVRSLNVSLDTLDREKFAVLTRRDQFERVWQNIQLLLQAGLHTKINVVLLRGVNDAEILDFVELTRYLPLHIRFIEFMPFVQNAWNENKVVPFQEILERITNQFEIEKLSDAPNDTAKKFRVAGFAGTFAVITTVSDLFCAGCNRMRLTADGKMKNCLFSNTETDLLT
ncbi:MAG: GTP 3',8-cyclase MoaA, partial [Saprospiraceae bacterium]